ncbi:MAG: LLM class F420-dependent oxidoreductase [Microthrixaceae bacterium]
MTEPSPPLGVTFASFQALGLPVGLEVARAAREGGYSSFWTAETTGPEAFATLGAVAAGVGGLDLGTGVLALQLRTPMLAAMGAATLQALAPEHDVLLGVGISSPVVVGRWHGAEYGERPVERVREYLELTRACLGGDAVTHEGAFWQCSGFRLGVRLGERRPRLVLGALNARMLRLAGELADGVLLNYLPATAVPWCVERVREGEARAGRPPGSCTVYAYVHVGVCDREAARPAARKDLFSYAVVPAYAAAFERAGFAEEVAALRAARERRDREASVAAMSDRMVDAIDICGTADEITAAVRAYVDAGVDVPVVMPLPWGEDRTGTILATLDAARRA